LLFSIFYFLKKEPPMSNSEELIYGFDPLCGWCFAFRPTMAAVREAFPTMPIRLLMGGLVLGERVRPIAHDRDYLIRGLEQVRQTAGVSAGKAFFEGLLAEGTYVSNSEPPCRAVQVAIELDPTRAYSFADSLPEAYYGRGLAPDRPEVIGELAAAQGYDAEQFIERWQSDQARQATQAAFAAARAEGISMYPTLLYRNGEQRTLIGRGYLAPYAAVQQITALR
jgi:putative protein-disulfide isomerase